MNNPLVSICVITFNHAPFIKDCFEGFLMQETSFDFEILIHDDASIDNTVDIIKSYQEKYPNLIKPIFQKENKYSKGQRLLNLRFNFPRAQGKYIALCDGDDYWADPYKLQKQVDFLENNPGYVLTHHDSSIIDEQDNILKTSKLPDKNKRDLLAFELQQGPFLLTLTLCFRNVLNNFPEEFFKVVNGDKIIISLLGQHGKGRFLDEIQPAVYRTHDGGVWSKTNKIKKRENLFYTYHQLAKYYKRKNKKDLNLYFTEKSKNLYAGIITFYLCNNDWKNYFKSIDYIVKSKDRNFLSKAHFLLRTSFKGMGSLIKKRIKKHIFNN